jgi:predicted P-loop ATPase
MGSDRFHYLEQPMINEDHLQEWAVNSAVSEEITRLNVVTLTDHREIDQKLQRNAKRRTKHTDYGEGGWWVSGVDPLTGEPQGIGGQFKPDVPTDPKRRYLGISDLESAPLFLDVGDRHYWQKVIEGVEPIMITEGAKKAGAALTAGIPCISISGVFNGQKKGQVKDSLAQFCKVGRRIILGFDADQITNPKVKNALDQLGRLIAELGSTVKVLQLPQETKGLDDYAVAHGHKALSELVTKAIPFEEWRQLGKQEGEDTFVEHISRKQQEIKNLRAIYAKRLRVNVRGSQVELDKIPIKPDYLYLECLEKYGLNVGKELIVDAFLMFANEQEYDPVRDYLDQCYENYGDSTIHLLENASTRYLGTQEPIYNTYLKKTLVAAVKRTHEPGCKFDTAIVFQGGQGLGKSTFWRVLAGDAFFDDNVQGFDRDDQQKLHKFWIEELGEIDKISNKNDVSVIKAFLSRQYDTFRVPFGRSSNSYARKFIIVGSTNKVEFLQDSTGDRRFWVIPLPKPVDLEALRIERDQLWAAAVALYKQGETIYLPKEQDEQRNEINKIFRADDPWEEAIAEFLRFETETKITDILANCLKIDIERHDRRSQTRVAEVLRALGWEKQHTRNGKIWKKCEKDGSLGSQGSIPYTEQNTDVTLISIESHNSVSVGHNKENLDSNFVTHDPCDSSFLTKPTFAKLQKNKELAIQVGDQVEILTGQQYGKIAEVLAIANQIVTVRNHKWVFNRDYDFSEVKKYEK